MRVLIVNPSFVQNDYEAPLGALNVATFLRKNRVNCDFLDLVFGYDSNYFSNFISNHQYDLIGFTSMSLHFPNVLKLVKIIKKQSPNIKIVVGGAHATLFSKEILRLYPNIDFVIVGEGEIPMLYLFKVLEKGGDFYDVPNLVFRNGETIVETKRLFTPNLDYLGFPDRTLLNSLKGYLIAYSRSIGLGNKGMNLIASRGCYFNCSYCQPVLNKIHGKGVRFRSVDHVIEEIRFLKLKYGISYFWFEDDTFTVNKQWVYEFCSKVEREKVFWSVNSRVDTITYDLMNSMKSAGCYMIRFGFESGSSETLKGFNKYFHPNQSLKVARWAKRLGILVYGYFMLGGTDYKREDLMKTEKLISQIDADFNQITMFNPLPKTAAREIIESKEGYSINSDLSKLNYFEHCILDTPYMNHKEIEKEYKRIVKRFPFFRKLDFPFKIPILVWCEIRFIIYKNFSGSKRSSIAFFRDLIVYFWSNLKSLFEGILKKINDIFK